MDAKSLEDYAAYYLARLAEDPGATHDLATADSRIVPILVRAFRSEKADAEVAYRGVAAKWVDTGFR
jgi:hypothetical protein